MFSSLLEGEALAQESIPVGYDRSLTLPRSQQGNQPLKHLVLVLVLKEVVAFTVVVGNAEYLQQMELVRPGEVQDTITAAKWVTWDLKKLLCLDHPKQRSVTRTRDLIVQPQELADISGWWEETEKLLTTMVGLVEVALGALMVALGVVVGFLVVEGEQPTVGEEVVDLLIMETFHERQHFRKGVDQ